MRGISMVMLVIATAGCSADPASVAVSAAPADLAAFTSCPVVNGTWWPCEPEGDNPVFVEVGAAAPSGWSCLSFSDQRFERPPDTTYPFPDWYTYYGPALGGDEAPGTFQLGFLYDAHDDATAVRGAAQVVSEDETLTYVWEGPARGFVRLPVPITEAAVLVEGVLYPAPGPVLGEHVHEALPDPRNDVTGAPAQEFWSRGPWTPPPRSVATGPDPSWQWDMVRVVDAGAQRLFPAAENAMPLGHGDMRRLQGDQHWGQYRQGAANATVPDVHASTLTPYLEFYFEAKNIRNTGLAAVVDFLCRCPDIDLLTVDGVFCLLGTPPPIIETRAGVVAGIRVSA